MNTNDKNNSGNTNSPILNGRQYIPRNSTGSLDTDAIFRQFSSSVKEFNSLVSQWSKIIKSSDQNKPSRQYSQLSVIKDSEIKSSRDTMKALQDLTHYIKDTTVKLNRSGLSDVAEQLGRDIQSQGNIFAESAKAAEKKLEDLYRAQLDSEKELNEKLKKLQDSRMSAESELTANENAYNQALKQFTIAQTKYTQEKSKDSLDELITARKLKEDREKSLRSSKDLIKEYDNAINEIHKEHNKSQQDYQAAKIEYNQKVTDLADFVERMGNTVNDLNKTSENINNYLDELPDLFNYEKSYSKLPEFLRILRPSEGTQKAEDREKEKLNEQIQEQEKELELIRINKEKESENINNFKQAIEDLQKAIDKADEAGDVDTKNAKQEELNEKQKELRDAESRALNLDNQEKEVVMAQKLNKAQLNVLEIVQSKSVKMLTYLSNSLSNIVSSLAGKYMDQFISGFDRIYSTLEDTQNSMARQVKMSSGAYDAYADHLHDIVTDAGYTAITTGELLEQSAVMADMGISNEYLMEALAVGGAKFKASGTDINIDENMAKLAQQLFEKTKGETGSDEQAAAEVSKMLDAFMGTQRFLVENFNSATAVSNGGWQEIVSAISEPMKEMNAGADQIAQTASSIAIIEQIAENNGQDASVLTEAFSTILNTRGTGNLSTEFLALVQKFGWDADTIKSAMQSGNVTDFFKDVMTNYMELYGGLDSSSTGYTLDAFNSSLTVTQAMNYGNNGSSIIDDYNNLGFTMSDIYNAAASEEESLQTGEFISKTKQFDNSMEEKAYSIASSAQQDLIHGNDLVRDGFNMVKDGISSILEFLMTTFALKSLGDLIPGVTGGSTGLLENSSATVSNFIGGKSGSIAGTVGNVVGGVAGAGMMLYSVYDNAKNAEDIGTALSDTFCDPTFYTGLGTTLGTVIAGPLGGAVGGALGNVASKIGNNLADPISEFLMNVTGQYDELKEEEEAQKRIQESADKLNDAAMAHMQAADAIKGNLEQQQASFSSFTENDKKVWLLQNKNLLQESNLIEKNESLNLNETDVNKLFDDAVEKWVEQQNREYEQERLKGQLQGDYTDLISDTIGVDNFSDLSIENAPSLVDIRDKLISASEDLSNAKTPEETKRALQEWESVQQELDSAEIFSDLTPATLMGMSDSAVANYLNNLQPTIDELNNQKETNSDLRTFQTDGRGSKMLEDVTSYLKNQNSDNPDYVPSSNDYTQALTEIYGDALDKSKISEMSLLLGELQNRKSNWESKNSEFQARWKNAKNKAGSDDIESIWSTYVQEYGIYPNIQTSDPSQANFLVDDMGNLVPNIKLDSEGIPILRYMDLHGRELYNQDWIDGKYATGIGYVPYDNYFALLHEGETVLNKQAAENYRHESIIDVDYLDTALSNAVDTIVNNQSVVYGDVSNSTNTSTNPYISVDINPVTSAINSQSDRIELLLQKILQVLSTHKYSRSPSSNSSVTRLDSSLPRMAQ